MGAITWGLNRARLATVFCIRCRTVFERDLTPGEALEVKNRNENHQCMPVAVHTQQDQKQCKPPTKKTQ